MKHATWNIHPAMINRYQQYQEATADEDMLDDEEEYLEEDDQPLDD